LEAPAPVVTEEVAATEEAPVVTEEVVTEETTEG
jgi:hypothetical protein